MPRNDKITQRQKFGAQSAFVEEADEEEKDDSRKRAKKILFQGLGEYLADFPGQPITVVFTENEETRKVFPGGKGITYYTVRVIATREFGE